jgi:hypothetical protein
MSTKQRIHVNQAAYSCQPSSVFMSTKQRIHVKQYVVIDWLFLGEKIQWTKINTGKLKKNPNKECGVFMLQL